MFNLCVLLAGHDMAFIICWCISWSCEFKPPSLQKKTTKKFDDKKLQKKWSSEILGLIQ